MLENYIFTSERLGFREWKTTDVSRLYEIHSNPNVMKFFPTIPSLEETEAFIKRMQIQYKESGYCYFAVERLDTHECIGFIGLSYQTYDAEFTPCVDIGWRLDEAFWFNGYATEGAKACLRYAFNVLKLEEIIAVCPKVNIPSEKVMKNIGMKKAFEFNHKALSNYPELECCVCYKINILDYNV